MEIAIIGGGASGLIAAIAAKHDKNTVTVYERSKRVGRKILATGNGRCNMTNMGAELKNYHGKNPKFILGAVNRFWVRETIEFFAQLGVLAKEERDGKVYPYSDTASSVLDVLRRKTDEIGVVTKCDTDIRSVEKDGERFRITPYDGKPFYADRVIIAAGGKASPDLGSNGSGYDILKRLGHGITELKPSLVQIKTEPDIVKKLKGIKINARAKLGKNEASGEILFTDYGLSGPPIFTLSSRMGKSEYVAIDIMPEYDYSELLDILFERISYLYNVPLEEFFTGMLNKRVGQALLKDANVSPLSRKAATLTQKEIETIAKKIKDWRFKIIGTMSWNNAQVTKGGAVTSEFNSVTMQSNLVKGLYACGEVLDIDGDCGGYNLQWAWSSGYLAGVSASNA